MDRREFNSREEYVDYIKKSRADEKWYRDFKERVKARQERERLARKRKIKFVTGMAATVALSVSMFLGARALHKYNIVDPDDIRYDQIITDMMIHAHAGEVNPKGHVMGAYDDHQCVAPYDGKTYYTIRLEDAMEGQYSDVVIQETIKLFEPLKDATSYEEVTEIKKKLNEIKDSLYKNDEGIWDSNINFKEQKRSK